MFWCSVIQISWKSWNPASSDSSSSQIHRILMVTVYGSKYPILELQHTHYLWKKNNRATYFDDACGRRRLSNNFLFSRPLRTSDSSFCARIQRGFFREWHTILTKIMLFSNFRGKQTKLRVVTKVSGLEWSSVWEHDTWYERLQMLVIIVIVRWNVV